MFWQVVRVSIATALHMRLKIIRQTFQKQDALGDFISFLHDADQLLVLLVVEFFQSLVTKHTGMQEVLVD